MNSDYKIILMKPALKFIKKQDQTTKRRIQKAVDGLKFDPPYGDIKYMKGEAEKDTFRLRIGGYRVIFEKDNIEKVIYIIAIGNRGDIYKK